MIKVNVLAVATIILCYAPALAGDAAPVPLPAAGAAGPVGVAFALAGYVGYRIFRKKD